MSTNDEKQGIVMAFLRGFTGKAAELMQAAGYLVPKEELGRKKGSFNEQEKISEEFHSSVKEYADTTRDALFNDGEASYQELFSLKEKVGNLMMKLLR